MSWNRVALGLLAPVVLACTPGASAPEAAAATPPTDERQPEDILSRGKPLYSHAKEELVIRHFFRDRRGGFFLDVGCGHPIHDSNTYYLEKHLGWSGIGVDALAEMARKWKRNRPASRFFNFLVTDHAETVDSFYRAEDGVTDISSIEKPGPERHGIRFEQIRVKTTTLTRLLDQAGVSGIDFLSMDIEGAEPLALAGFDIDRFRPQLACIEAKLRNREKILEYFGDHGYSRIEGYLRYDPMNYYFTPRARHR